MKENKYEGFKEKIVAIVMCLVICCCYTVNICASELNNVLIDKNIEQIDEEMCSEEIATWAVAHCGRYATHDMLSRGWGAIQKSDGTWVVEMGACHQCTRCNLVFVCEGEPLCSKIGHWATFEANEPVKYYCFVYTDNIHYEEGKTVEGMSFRY